MTTLLRSVPGQPNIRIQYLDESLQFIGNNVQTISIDDVRFGCSFILDEFDSLKEIEIKKPGAVISFNSFPKQTIRIKGAFEEIRVKDGSDFYNLHRYGSNPTLPIGNLWGAVVTRDETISNKGADAILIKTDGIKDLSISDEWSHITVIGDKKLQQIGVTGNSVIRSFHVHKGPALKSVKLERRVLSCSLNGCPSIDTITGFGDRLSLHPKPRKKNSLSIGGFWHQVPEWYDLQVTLLKIPHFKAHLTVEEIIHCKDMGGVKIQPYTYDSRGGQIHFSEVLGVDIETAARGISITDMVRLIEEKTEPALGLLESWCSYTIDWFDQYKTMRVLASLISRGYDPKPIIRLRNTIFDINIGMPKLISGSVNDGANDSRLGGKWKQLFSGESEEWETPKNSIMPFGRLDLEIWLNTDLEPQFLGLKKDIGHPARFSRRRHLGENGVIRNILTATLSAANTVGRNDMAEHKLTNLATSLYTNPVINSDPFCCEFTVYHLSVSRVATKPVIQALVEGIMNMADAAWKRAALLVGVVDITNSPRARMALKRLASDKDFNITESSKINAISIAGRRAFDSGKVERPDWPYLLSWQTKYRK